MNTIVDKEITKKIDADKPEEKKIFSENATEVLERRYLTKDIEGKIIETPKEMLLRVAKFVAESDKKYSNISDIESTTQDFLEMMINKDFMPNSPTLMNAGKEMGQLSACFVLPIEDSMESIFETLRDTALIHKSGGGTGFSFSRIRPRNSIVKSTSGVASGPISFMKVYNASTEAVKQGGTRRGANMGVLRIDHPDILEFINCKENNNDLNNFNISVAVTNEFMEKVHKNEMYDLKDPKTGKIVSQLDAGKIFDLIAERAWKNGDPGLLFIDKINEENPTPQDGLIEATNPCGEQPLLPNEACNLGSINLSNFVKDNDIDYPRLKDVVQKSIHFLDNVIDVNKYPLKKIEEQVNKNRKIGLGVMGFADVLFQLGIPYNSDDAIKLSDTIMQFIYNESKSQSEKMATERGTFPAWENSRYAEKNIKVRNASFLTIAPTGSISMIADCSSGIEPIFSLVFTKRVMDNTDFLYVNPHFENACKKAGIYSDELMKEVAQNGTIQNMEEIPENIRKVFVTAHDINPIQHILIQSSFQKWVDAAVSKTCNFPSSATVANVKDAYWLAYETNCKGITIYRDGSRTEQVLYVGDKKDQKVETEKELPPKKENGSPIHPRLRPQTTAGVTRRIRTGQGSLYVTINEDSKGLSEIFTNIGKAGSQAQVESEAISRLISLALRSGIDPIDIIKQLKGIGGPSPIWENGIRILSTPDAIAKALEWYMEENFKKSTILKASSEKEIITVKEESDSPVSDNKKMITTCPDCGCNLYHESGCVSCPSCGFSKC